MKKNKVIIISVDALNTKDLDFIKTLPTFGQLLKNGSYVTGANPVYPSLTYPSHTAIATGCFPDRHGLDNNEIPDPKRLLNLEWHWYKSHIKVPTIFDYAEEAGYKVGTVFWPVMAGSGFPYCLPEIYAPDGSESTAKLIWKYGSKNLFPVILKNSRLLDGMNHPQLDNFADRIAQYILKRTDFTAIHYTQLDSVRHHHGLKCEESRDALRLIDKRIYRILKNLKDNNQLENTTIAVLGDHGTHTYSKIVELNSLFKQHGLLSSHKEGELDSYKAYSVTCGGSVHVFLNKENSKEDNEKIDKLLRDFSKDDCVAHLFTKDEYEKDFHLKGDFSYVLEAGDDYVFRNTISDEVKRDRTHDHHQYMGDHGYLPTHEDMQTMLIMVGKNIKKNFHIHGCKIVDFGPTIAKAVGMEMKNTDGNVLERIFDNGRLIY